MTCLETRLNLVKGLKQTDLPTFLTTATDAVAALDPEGRLLSMNAEAERLLGRPAAELEGKDFFAETQLKFTDIATLGAAPCPAFGGVDCAHLNLNARLNRCDGSGFEVSFMLASVFDAGRVVGKVFVFRAAAETSPTTRTDAGGTEAEIVAQTAALVVRLDAEGRVDFCNHPGRWLFGDVPVEEFLPEAVPSLLRDCPNQLDQQTLVDRRWSPHEEREICVAWSVSVLRDGQGVVSGAVCTAIDCTDHALYEQGQAQQRRMAQMVFEHITDGVITVDAAGQVEYLNAVAERLTGWPLEEAQGLPLKDIYHVVDEQTLQPREDPVNRCLKLPGCGERGKSAETGILLRRGGWEFSISDAAVVARDAEGTISGAVLVFSDLSELRGLERWVEYESSHDHLTGLINRRQFEAHLQAALDGAHQEKRQHALFYLDLDHFQVINDSYGHQAGDQLLKELSRHLRGMLEETVCMARLGDDEFGLIVEDTPTDEARQLGQRLCRAVRAYRFAWEDRPCEIGASIGLVPITERWRDVGELMRMADSACYVAKEQGGNRVHVYEVRDVAMAQRQGDMQWIQRVRDALNADRFRLYCQSIVPLVDAAQAPAHYEILLRMIDEEGGVIRPAAFIAAAERYHLMPEVDRWVVLNALQLLAGRRERGHEGSMFSINISGQSLDEEGFLAFVVEALRQSGVPPASLCFEITETAAASNMRIAQRFIRELRALGCRFALDDFGRGISSFAYLKNLEVDYLKIDGMFVKDLADDEIGHAMVESINNIGHTMGVQTIAEFVETQAVLEKLVALGVDHVQGYQLGRPRPLAPMFRVPA